MLGVMLLILASELWSASGEDDFFSVARTMPLVAAQSQFWRLMEGSGCPMTGYIPLIPRAVMPWLTAFRAYSVWKLSVFDQSARWG